MKECFEPYTRSQLQAKYQFLIVDGYVSHVLTVFIIYT